MKTLDEVIDCMERCSKPHYFDCNGCPYEDEEAECGCHPEERDADVLHYLREYRDKHEEMLQMEEALGYCEISENRPLTWDELRQMEGKPVWVELFGSGLGEWDIKHAQLDDQIWFADGNGLIFDLNKVNQGKTWQAYRKERHER